MTMGLVMCFGETRAFFSWDSFCWMKPPAMSMTSHDYELEDQGKTYLSIDCAVLGLGNSSCGPGILKKYAIDKSRPHKLHIRIIN